MSAIRSPVFVLINLKAGSCKPDSIESQLRDAAGVAGVELKVIRTKSGKRRKTRRAVAEGFQTVIAVGGDGTVSKVASDCSGHDVDVGIVPAGTANLLAKELKIPSDFTEPHFRSGY